ncbi:MAG: amidohydrolase [Clostridium sp.]|nr:amidohydrolase [Clostridium sp.]
MKYEYILQSCLELRHRLHKNPELSNNEVETMKIIKEFIRSNSNMKIIEKSGYFYAMSFKGKEYENVAFRADMDALPIEEKNDFLYKSINKGVAHKCGHDGHCAAIASICLFAEEIKNKNIFLLFQPAEEIGTGAKLIVEDNFLKDNKINNIYAFHNIPKKSKGVIYFAENIFAYASKGIVIKLNGKTSHAAYPEFGVNPAYAVADIVSYVKDITNLVKFENGAMCTIISIKVGDKAFGTSAGYGEILLTIRAEREKDLQILQNSITKCVEKISKEHKIKSELEFCDEFPETLNSSREVKRLKKLCIDNKIKYEELNEPFRWSEDFGYYTKEIPGVIFGIGAGEKWDQLHTEYYDFPDEILSNVINIFFHITSL